MLGNSFQSIKWIRRPAQESGGRTGLSHYNSSMTRSDTYLQVSEALEWLAAHQEQQPALEEVADAIGMSPFHLQRTFQRWAGVSPKKFLQALTRDAAIARLQRGESVLDAALGSGLSGPGRLHDLLLTTEALTPGEVKRGGAGIALRFGFGGCLFGHALIAWTQRGINFLGFCNEMDRAAAQAELRDRWPNANLIRDDAGANAWLKRVFSTAPATPLPLWLRGSPFQLQVWQALLAIPEDSNVSYGLIAKAIGKPGAARAVGNAVGSNPIAWIIPCHRVIRQMGELGGYHWGVATKRAMIGYEHARLSVTP
jgi:AraC family transcriptional regulator of adaptative response/methylated-DNA-[protein]-cysteine methyltransferase